MGGLGNAFLSLIAVTISCVTTYFTLFYERPILNAAISKVQLSSQTGSGWSQDTGLTVTYRRFAEVSLILANDGNRAVVLTQTRLVRSSSPDACQASDTRLAAFDRGTDATLVIGQGDVEPVRLEFGLPSIDAAFSGRSPTAAEIGALNADAAPALWCLETVAFDHRGQRQEMLFPAFTADATFTAGDDEGDAPVMSLSVDYPRGAVSLVG